MGGHLFLLPAESNRGPINGTWRSPVTALCNNA